jgi:hypothetical protein
LQKLDAWAWSGINTIFVVPPQRLQYSTAASVGSKQARGGRSGDGEGKSRNPENPRSLIADD